MGNYGDYDKDEIFYIDGVKGDKEFAMKHCEIVNGPDRPLVKKQKIRKITGDYFRYRLSKGWEEMHKNIVKNMETLALYTGRQCTPTNVSRYMGIAGPPDFFSYWTEDHYLNSFRSAVLISEFYAVPVEMLMFQDIKALYGSREIFEEKYASLIRQTRH